MIVAAAAVSLALPYLTKVAIDRHILPLGRLFHLKSPQDLALGALPNEMIGRLKPEMLLTAADGLYVLPADKAALIDRRQERALVASGRLAPEKYYFRPVLPDPAWAESDKTGAPAVGDGAPTKGAPRKNGTDRTALAPDAAQAVLARCPHGLMAGSLLAIPERDLVRLKGSLALTLRGVDVDWEREKRWARRVSLRLWPSRWEAASR